MISKKFPLVLFLFALSACMMAPVISIYQARNDLVLKDSWKNFLLSHPHPKVVLRVPDSPKEITQSEMMSFNSLYNYIEKRMLEANFTVRDRSLLKEVLTRAGGELNYAEIGKKIDTDVIVEIVSVRFGTWMQGLISPENQSAPPKSIGRRSDASDPNEDRGEMASSGPSAKNDDLLAANPQLGPRNKVSVGPGEGRSNNEVFGAILEGRIIMVATGDIVGMFTIKEIHPYPEEWFWTDSDKRPVKISGGDLNESTIEYLKTVITNKLVAFINGQSVPDSVVSSSESSASSGRIGRWKS